MYLSKRQLSCSWSGHCLGDSCPANSPNNFNQCDSNLVCDNSQGLCVPPTPSSSSSCSIDNDCHGQGQGQGNICINKKCKSSGGLKGDWKTCSKSSECENGCCSREDSTQLMCTPSGSQCLSAPPSSPPPPPPQQQAPQQQAQSRQQQQAQPVQSQTSPSSSPPPAPAPPQASTTTSRAPVSQSPPSVSSSSSPLPSIDIGTPMSQLSTNNASAGSSNNPAATIASNSLNTADAGIAVPTTTSSSSNQQTPALSAGNGASAAGENSITSSSLLSPGAIAGIVIAIIALLIMGMSALIYRHRRHHGNQLNQTGPDNLFKTSSSPTMTKRQPPIPPPLAPSTKAFILPSNEAAASGIARSSQLDSARFNTANSINFFDVLMGSRLSGARFDSVKENTMNKM